MAEILAFTYNRSKALPNKNEVLPNAPMAKAHTPDRHIGHRLQEEMEARRLSAAEIARLFDVKPPSVYDWIRHGRIAKKHIPRLTQLFGHSADWWLIGEEAPSGQPVSTGVPHHLTRIAAVLEGRSAAEIDRIARALELLLTPAEHNKTASSAKSKKT